MYTRSDSIPKNSCPPETDTNDNLTYDTSKFVDKFIYEELQPDRFKRIQDTFRTALLNGLNEILKKSLQNWQKKFKKLMQVFSEIDIKLSNTAEVVAVRALTGEAYAKYIAKVQSEHAHILEDT